MINFKKKNINTTYKQLITENKVAPTIIFSKKSMMWISALIENHNHEVGFYATVNEIGDYQFYIDRVYYPKHSEADCGTCTISSTGEYELVQFMIEKNRFDEINKIRLWGHKHMSGTSPTDQDEYQTMDRIKSTNSYLIRVICDEKEMSVSFFDPSKNIRFDNINWVVEKDNQEDNLKKINKIKDIINECNLNESDSITKTINAILESTSDLSIYNKIVNKVLQLKKINIKNNINKDYFDNNINKDYFDNNINKDNFDNNINSNISQEFLFNRSRYNDFNYSQSKINNKINKLDKSDFKLDKSLDELDESKLSSKIEIIDNKKQIVFYYDNKIIEAKEYKKLLYHFNTKNIINYNLKNNGSNYDL